MAARRHFFEHDECDVVQDLQDEHEEDDLLLPIVQVRLDEGPPRADKQNDREEEQRFEEGDDVVHDGPRLRAAREGDIVVPHAVEEQGQALERHQHQHQLVDAVHVVAALPQQPGPHASRRREAEEEEEEHRGQLLLAGRQVVGARVPEGRV